MAEAPSELVLYGDSQLLEEPELRSLHLIVNTMVTTRSATETSRNSHYRAFASSSRAEIGSHAPNTPPSNVPRPGAISNPFAPSPGRLSDPLAPKLPRWSHVRTRYRTSTRRIFQLDESQEANTSAKVRKGKGKQKAVSKGITKKQTKAEKAKASQIPQLQKQERAKKLQAIKAKRKAKQQKNDTKAKGTSKAKQQKTDTKTKGTGKAKKKQKKTNTPQQRKNRKANARQAASDDSDSDEYFSADDNPAFLLGPKRHKTVAHLGMPSDRMAASSTFQAPMLAGLGESDLGESDLSDMSVDMGRMHVTVDGQPLSTAATETTVGSDTLPFVLDAEPSEVDYVETRRDILPRRRGGRRGRNKRVIRGDDLIIDDSQDDVNDEQRALEEDYMMHAEGDIDGYQTLSLDRDPIEYDIPMSALLDPSIPQYDRFHELLPAHVYTDEDPSARSAGFLPLTHLNNASSSTFSTNGSGRGIKDTCFNWTYQD
ncbi:uncharacterized protein BYT42DRAFT_135686 [Radiomyces spectabilis]|uniref:uncharacterized protein n=1 Tax=Radiomyces spectabilis TaxID=64574 RepID=UPI0022210ED1|nr:uncharacterized protein BYT42DRAFT_135686 [Radiomyces spectabilis]KAI8367699.1 hypothetical protein BYT42DRAFT_135686 [Radiomyces spectabilis]